MSARKVFGRVTVELAGKPVKLELHETEIIARPHKAQWIYALKLHKLALLVLSEGSKRRERTRKTKHENDEHETMSRPLGKT